MGEPVVVVEGLRKSFGDVHALKGVDFEIPAGSIFGLLGPNGAGKTTAVRILTTLLRPDGGVARVAGLDVVRDAERLRGEIGLAGQSAAVDGNLTGLENLEMVGRLYHLPKAEAKRRAAEVIERLGLADAGDRVARTYSGGMRRRLYLGASLVGRPRVLFLDEPTTGLDPRSRVGLWEMIRELQADGITLLLTTQYLEEADILTDNIAVIDLGTVIASGSPDELKTRIGGELLEVAPTDHGRVREIAGLLAGLGTGDPVVDEETHRVRLPVGNGGPKVLLEAVRRIDQAGVPLEEVALHRPTLDDVFLTLTGHAASDAEEQQAPATGRGRPRKAVGGRR
ncbi:MAG: ATP-binding cassette domain-containing protein [Actinomycetota bacterium]